MINCLVGNVVSNTINVELMTLDDCGLLQGFLWMQTSALYITLKLFWVTSEVSEELFLTDLTGLAGQLFLLWSASDQ